MSRVMTYLSKDEYARFRKICDREGCTPYMLFKKAVLDHIWDYPLEKAPPSEKGNLKQDLEEDAVEEVVEPEPAMGQAEEIAESVRKILEGKKE